MSQKRTIEITENDSNKKQKKTTHIQNPNQAIVKQIERILNENNLNNIIDNSYKNIIYTNGSEEIIKNMVDLNSEVRLLNF